MNLNDIMEIGTLDNIKVEDIRTNQIEKRNLLVFIFLDNSTHYLDIDAGQELAEYEKVLANSKTKIHSIYKNQKLLLEDFKNAHPNFDIKLEDGVLKVNKKIRGKNGKSQKQ